MCKKWAFEMRKGVRKFGFNDNESSIEEYWKIPSTYWNDDEIKNAVFYMKLNIF